MHTALWALAAVSFVGMFVCLLRPSHAQSRDEATADAPLEPIAELGVGAIDPLLETRPPVHVEAPSSAPVRASAR